MQHGPGKQDIAPCARRVLMTLALGVVAAGAAAQTSPILGLEIAVGSKLLCREVVLPPLGDETLVAVMLAGDGVPWLATARRFWHLDADGWQVVGHNLGLARIRALGRFGNTGTVIVATDQGVWFAKRRPGAIPGWRSQRHAVEVERVSGLETDVEIVASLPLPGPLFGAALVRADGQIQGIRLEAGSRAEPPWPKVGSPGAVFTVPTHDGGSVFAARGGTELLVLDRDGRTRSKGAYDIFGGHDTIRDAIYDPQGRASISAGTRQVEEALFLAGSSGIRRVRLISDFNFKSDLFWSEPSQCLGLFAGRLLAIVSAEMPPDRGVLWAERRLRVSASGERENMLPWPVKGGPGHVTVAVQVDSDLCWAEDDGGAQWEWSPDGWQQLHDGDFDLTSVERDAGVVRIIRLKHGNRVVACMPREAEGWQSHEVAAAIACPDPCDEGFWVLDEAACEGTAAPRFVTPHGVVVGPTPAPELRAPRMAARLSVMQRDGTATWGVSAEHLLLPMGKGFAILRGGECSFSPGPRDLKQLVPAGGSHFTAAYLALSPADSALWRVAAVGLTSIYNVPEVHLEYLSGFDLERSGLDTEPVLLPDTRGAIWLAYCRAGVWQAAKIVATGRGEEITLGALPEPPVSFDLADDLSVLGDRVVATAHGISRVPRTGNAPPIWQRLLADSEVSGIGPAWARPVVVPFQRALFTQQPMAGESRPGQAMSLSLMSPGSEPITGPNRFEGAVLAAVLATGAAEPTRAVWVDHASQGTLVEWNQDGNAATSRVPGIGAARHVAVIDQPTAMASSLKWSTRMVAIADGKRVAVQRLPRTVTWTDSPIVAPIRIELRDAEEVRQTLYPLTEDLPAVVPSWTTAIDVVLAPDPADWWHSGPEAIVTVNGHATGNRTANTVRVSVDSGVQHELAIEAPNRCATSRWDSVAWRFRVEPEPVVVPPPSLFPSAWIGIGLVISALAWWVTFTKRRSKVVRDREGIGGLPEDAKVHTFVCYSREDENYVLALASALDEVGAATGIKTWVDQRDIPAGADWDICIDQAIEKCALFLIVWSPDAKGSPNVRGELNRAAKLRKPILTVMHREAEPHRLMLVQIADATGKPADDVVTTQRILAGMRTALAMPGR